MLGKSLKQVSQQQQHHGVTKDIPKGYVAIKVGQGKEQKKIAVPVTYLNHPLFVQLLKEAEEVYGFAHRGTIIIPCQLAEFQCVQDLIGSTHNNNKSFQHHRHLVGCLRA